MEVQRFRHCVRASARVGCMGTGFCDDSVLHGPTTPYTMERMTLIVPRSKSISPHFKPNISLCINRVAAERDIRLKVGRYRLRARHDERHPFHRVRSGRPVQDRSIAKACANASDSRGRSDAVEKTLCLHQDRGLGFCKQALSGPKAVLGPGDLAQIHTSCSATSLHSEAIRMPYVPAHLLSPAAHFSDPVQLLPD